MLINKFAITILFFLITLPAFSQTEVLVDTTQALLPSYPTPESPGKVLVKDTPNDAGGALVINWTLSPSDQAIVNKYQVLRSTNPESGFEVVGKTVKGQSDFTDNNAIDGEMFYYKIRAVAEHLSADGSIVETSSESEVVGPRYSSAQWIHLGRINVLLWTIVISGAILLYISAAKKGKMLYIRKLAGIEAVEEAIGRATEMGRKIYYVPGIQDMDDMQTVASMPILGKVAEISARNDTYLEVPVCRSLVMVTAREAVKEAYARVGKPDAFNENQVHYLTDDQFGYAAAIDGMVVREKPATIFYMGAFFAESLILAETGNAAGAIQIAGTAMPSQLPFFITACDYTLIGEELFAASAYLSREPKLLGSLKGQDVGKALFIIAIVLGIILEIIGVKLGDFSFLDILKVS